MRFEHAPDVSYADVGGGTVLHSAPGYPGFPARLAVELFDRARALSGRERVGLWDPLAGAGGLVTTLAVLRGRHLTRVLATDVSDDALVLARRNLALLTTDGLAARRRELALRGVASERLAAVDRWAASLAPSRPLSSTARADATDAAALGALDLTGINLILADLPYGTQTDWAAEAGDAPRRLYAALRTVLPVGAVIVLVATDRTQFAELPPATRSFKHGHRHIRFYRVTEPPAPR